MRQSPTRKKIRGRAKHDSDWITRMAVCSFNQKTDLCMPEHLLYTEERHKKWQGFANFVPRPRVRQKRNFAMSVLPLALRKSNSSEERYVWHTKRCEFTNIHARVFILAKPYHTVRARTRSSFIWSHFQAKENKGRTGLVCWRLAAFPSRFIIVWKSLQEKPFQANPEDMQRNPPQCTVPFPLATRKEH